MAKDKCDEDEKPVHLPTNLANWKLSDLETLEKSRFVARAIAATAQFNLDLNDSYQIQFIYHIKIQIDGDVDWWLEGVVGEV